jgi:steroid delta-isomerase-like uncharacterized protein
LFSGAHFSAQQNALTQRTYLQQGKMSVAQNTERNKEVVRRIYEDCLNAGNLELLNEIVAEDYVGIGGQKGPSAVAETIQSLRQGFPDIHYTIEDLVAEENRVALRWRWRGTHEGSFRGFAASHQQVNDTGIAIYEFRDNKIIRAWIQTDQVGFLQQIGVVPKNLRSISRSAKNEDQTGSNPERIYRVDKFIVPNNGRKEFLDRVRQTHELLRTLPGFMQDFVLEQTAEPGEYNVVTIVEWESTESVENAKSAVLTRHKEMNFDPQELFNRIGIKADRAHYRRID